MRGKSGIQTEPGKRTVAKLRCFSLAGAKERQLSRETGTRLQIGATDMAAAKTTKTTKAAPAKAAPAKTAAPKSAKAKPAAKPAAKPSKKAKAGK